MNCAKLTNDIIGASCAQKSIVGVDGELIIINHADIDSKLTTVAEGVIGTLVLKAGAKAYKFETYNNAVSTETTLSKGTYVSAWIHKVIAKVFLRNQDIKTQIEKLKDGRFVVIVANKDKGNEGDTKYEAFGFYSGLELAEAISSSEDADSVIYSLTMATNEKSKESAMPISVFKTDITATKTMLDALLTVEPAA